MANESIEEYKVRIRKLLSLLTDTQAKLESLQSAYSGPCAIIGMACRFPGAAHTPSAFWNNLVHGVDGVRRIPKERWPVGAAPPSAAATRWAGLLDDVELFDAAFFGISPREATSLDPQQRILLEVVYEALESSGQRADRLVGSRTGVFVGISSTDYRERVMDKTESQWDAYDLIGNGLSTAAGRISYVFGFQGPCVAVDTACSASLVAVHQACQSLRACESDLAIAGGVNIILSAKVFAMATKLQAMSPEGRCRTFDAGANGFVRGEGCGMVVLKRLADALRDGDTIHAVVSGSAMNHDGRSPGLTVPNVLAQQALLRQALRDARIVGNALGYVETHGTGTPLGDPLEFEALKAVYGEERVDGSSCVLGAVKSNIGHLESAAGIAGLIKAVLCLKNQAIPANLHFRTLNPRITMDGTPFVIPTKTTPWPKGGRPRYAGVSSFGISGTNAHVILEEAPERTQDKRANILPSSYILPLSGKTPAALAALAQTYQEFLADEQATLHDIVYTASACRSHHTQRLAVIGGSKEELRRQLASYRPNGPAAGVICGAQLGEQNPAVVFVFAGQGSQWAGMGLSLLQREPVFCEVIRRCDAIVQQYADWSLLAQLSAPATSSRLAETAIAQPVLVAFEVALAELFKSWGVIPTGVIGHSVGELAAAHVAGILSLEEVMRVAVIRGRVMHRASGFGKMAAVAMPVSQARAALASYGPGIDIAAVNDPESVVFSGDPHTIDSIVAQESARGVESRLLRVNYAFHSPQMEPLLPDLLTQLGSITPQASTLTMWSTVTGERLRGEEVNARYFARNVRQTVQFAQAVFGAIHDGGQIFLELGPHPVLSANIALCIRSQTATAAAIPTLRREAAEQHNLLAALANVYCRGYSVDWKAVQGQVGRTVELPAYPWQRERYWIETSSATQGELAAKPCFASEQEASLLGHRVAVAGDSQLDLWQQEHSLDGIPYLKDHRLKSEVIFPGAGYLQMAVKAAIASLASGEVLLRRVNFERLLPLKPKDRVSSQLTLRHTAERQGLWEIFAREGQGTWQRYASGEVEVTDAPATEPAPPAGMWERRGQPMSKEHVYALLEQRHGLQYGRSFQGIQEAWLVPNRALARVQIPEGLTVDIDESFGMHPAMLDACLQTAALAVTSESGQPSHSYVPVGLDLARIHRRFSSEVFVYAQAVSADKGAEWLRVDLHIVDAERQPIAEFLGIRLRQLDGLEIDPVASCGYEVAWEVSLQPDSPTMQLPDRDGWLVLSDGGLFLAELMNALQEAGMRCVGAEASEHFSRRTDGVYQIDLNQPEDYARLLRCAFPQHKGCAGIIYLAEPLHLHALAQSVDAVADVSCSYSLYVTRLVQTMLQAAWPSMPRLVVITCGAQQIEEAPEEEKGVGALMQRPVWGLGRTLGLEHPELRRKWIDLSTRPQAADLRAVAQELLREIPAPEVALRNGKRYVSRLHFHRLPAEAMYQRTQWLQPDQTYLVTGGLKGLGLDAAERMARHGARHLVLVSRSGPTPLAQKTIERLQQMDVHVYVRCLDVGDEAAMQRLFEELGKTLPPLGGVLHCAAVIDDRAVLELQGEHFRTVFRSKVRGAWLLHQLTRSLPLSFFVMYSSGAGVVGSPGQGNYAAANAFLDGLASYRRLHGLPAHSIQWGAFSDVGLAANLTSQGQRLSHRGNQFLTPAEGFSALLRVIEQPKAVLAVMRLDFSALTQQYQALASSGLLDKVLSVRKKTSATASTSGEGEDADAFAALQRVPDSARLAMLETLVRQLVAQVLRIESQRLDREQHFQSYGLDSLMGLELRNSIEQYLRVRVPAPAIWTYGTVAQLAAYLAERLFPSGQPAADKSLLRDFTPLLADIRLAADLVVPSERPTTEKRADPQAVFLTGATGFIGAYLVSELLRRTKADLYCLINAPEPAAARAKMKAALQRAGRWRGDEDSRLQMVCGNLALPRFGLDEATHHKLAEQVDLIVHNGATVNWVPSYRDLRQANVLGTYEVLQLSLFRKLKPLHYISTGAISAIPHVQVQPGGAAPEPGDFIDEFMDGPYFNRRQLQLGYVQSKWVADELVLNTLLRGHCASIYRVPFVCGDSVTGVWNTRDYLCRLIKGCIELQAAPKQDGYIDMLTVDHVAERITDLTLKAGTLGKVFHLTNPTPVHWGAVLQWLRAQGYPIAQIEATEWLHRAQTSDSQSRMNAGSLYSLLPVFEGLPAERMLIGLAPRPTGIGPLLGRLTMVPDVATSLVGSAVIDEAVFAKFLQYFYDCGFVTPPASGPLQENAWSARHSPLRISSAASVPPSEGLPARKLAQLFAGLDRQQRQQLNWDAVATSLPAVRSQLSGRADDNVEARYRSAHEQLWNELKGLLDTDGDGVIRRSDFLRLGQLGERDVTAIGKLPTWLLRLCHAFFRVMGPDASGAVPKAEYLRFLASLGVAEDQAIASTQMLFGEKEALAVDDVEELFAEWLLADNLEARGNHLFGFLADPRLSE